MRGKLLDQIRTAVACGGNDPTTNIKLSGLVAQARGSGVPKTSMDSALKSTGSAGGEVREAVLYEGRGPSGYLVLIETLTDNRNRTRPEIRRLLEKQGYAVARDLMYIAWQTVYLTLSVHAQEGYGTCLVCVCVSSVNIIHFYSPSKVHTAFD